MRNKLALTIALASFGLVTALGVGFAGAEEVTTEARRIAAARFRSACSAAPACSNEVDDDKDGLIDNEDPDCESRRMTARQRKQRKLPSPPARPSATSDSNVEAPPTPEAPTEKHGGVKAGATIDAQGDGVRHNKSLGDISGGDGNSGAGISAPSATGGVQLHTKTRGRRLAVLERRHADRRPTRRRRSRPSARPRSASPTSSSTLSRSRPSCCRSTRHAAPSTGFPGRCSPRSTRSRLASAPTWTPSSAGAVGWMQFLPSSWEAFGLDANGDGTQGPLQPGRRNLRRRSLPEAGRWLEGSLQRDLLLQPR